MSTQNHLTDWSLSIPITTCELHVYETTHPDELLAGLTGLVSSGSDTGFTSSEPDWGACGNS